MVVPGSVLLGGAGAGQAVGVGAGLDDVAAEGEAVDDGGAEAGVGEGLGPAAEALVGRDRDAGFLFPLGEDLEQQLGAAAVQFGVSVRLLSLGTRDCGEPAQLILSGTAFERR
jgi:hypothetical protein